MSVKVYYRECPDCRAKWSAQLSTTNVIRLGKESFTCKCKKQWLTGHKEWAHLSPTERRAYFISEAEIGVLLLSIGTPALFALFLAQHQIIGALAAASYGLLFGLALVVVLWCLKSIYVRLSLRRCPYENRIELRGLLPWRW
jgi:uncharacterized membrane protein (DUF485 family)